MESLFRFNDFLVTKTVQEDGAELFSSLRCCMQLPKSLQALSLKSKSSTWKHAQRLTESDLSFNGGSSILDCLVGRLIRMTQ